MFMYFDSHATVRYYISVVGSWYLVAGASKHFFVVHGETAFGGNWA